MRAQLGEIPAADSSDPRRRGAAPPRWLEAAVLLAGAALLFFPLHVPYQNPDQDFPVRMALLDDVRGGWSPVSLHFPSALPNLLRAASAVARSIAWLLGHAVDRLDVLAAWQADHQPFRIAPRAIAMASGVATLVCVRGLVAYVADRWSAVAAVALLATAVGFVRESHHGMFDAPPAAAVAALLWASAVHVRTASRRSIVAAGALLGVAFAFKQHAAIAGVALVAALAAAPGSPGDRARRAGLAALAGALALLLLSPATLLEPVRFASMLRIHVTLLYAGKPQLLEADPPPYPLAAVLWNGVGPGLLVLAASGLFRAWRRRERALLPLVVYAVVYGAIAARSELVLNRYALPLFPCLAVLGGWALAALPRPLPRLALAAAVAALQLPPTAGYLRLLAADDTRVAAARWLRAHAAPDAVVLLPGGPLWSPYVAPDLSQPLSLPKSLEPELASAIASRMPPTFPRQWRWTNALPADADAVPQRFRGAIAVTAEHPSPRFARVMTPPRIVRALERRAELVADFPIARDGDSGAFAEAVYEPGDLNFAPVVGAEGLLRPGPRLRIWRIP